ncbi:1-acyl-sn-glycerol-3-phosphate acyltransferase [Kouleothrix sp.]|uniref:1-acyl-sn-glycerol-3-phosphate acyltransferase n=1 Tax=Kouleothrix sp. TaxID=2779161 RepID=UPI003918D364
MTTLDELTAINSQDLLTSMGLSQVRRGRAMLERLCRPPARRLARQILTYDALVASAGLQAAGAWVLGQYVGNVAVQGQPLPRTGPLLIVSNHPGLYDTLALFAAIPRGDLRVIAADRPFLRALPHTSRHLITVSEAAPDRSQVLRAAARHLRAGGALLTFPGGRIEPDPAVLPGAAAALEDWSASIAVFARLVPGLVVAPAVVSGVLSSAALRHPLAYLRGRQHQQLLAATLQIVFPSLQRGTVRVAFGRPIDAGALHGEGADVSAPIIAECRRLIERGAEASP